MLSGALLLNRDYELGSFLKKRFTRILYPFLFWITFILIGVYYLNGTTYLLDMFLGVGQFTWFIWVLMGMYLFIPIFNTFIKRYGIKAAEYYLVFWLFTTILAGFNLYPVGAFDLSLFNGWFGIVVLGYFLDNFEFKLDNSNVSIIGFLIFAMTLIANVYANYINYVPGFTSIASDLTAIALASGVFLFIKYSDNLNSLKDTLFGKLIISISICSYGMYFVHIMVVRPFLLLYPHQSLLMFPMIFMAVFLVSWLIIYSLNKVPHLRKVIGT